MEPWIQTHTGVAFTPLNPRPEQIEITDIAWALGNLCRFNGHTRTFYSVAEHCVRMSHAVTPQAALPALLHDGGEAYVSDVAAPLKHLVPALALIEDKIIEVIVAKWCPGLPQSVWDEVHACDKWIVHEEAKLLMGPPPQPWWPQPPFTPVSDPFPPVGGIGWHPAFATARYLARFKELTT